MKGMRWFMGVVLMLAFSSSALAAEDYVKVTYLPGHHPSGAVMEVVIKDAFSGGNPVIAQVYDKLKNLQSTGRWEYVWPDQASIRIEVSHQGEVLQASLTTGSGEDSEVFRNFSRIWHEAYAVIWDSMRKNMRPEG